jgi:hypothetical protein
MNFLRHVVGWVRSRVGSIWKAAALTLDRASRAEPRSTWFGVAEN